MHKHDGHWIGFQKLFELGRFPARNFIYTGCWNQCQQLLLKFVMPDNVINNPMQMQEILTILESAGNDWPINPLFHGTHSREAAESIVLTGLTPQGGSSKWKGDLSSVKGRSYLSGSLFYVLADYAMGDGGEPGYLLVFDKDALQDVTPDEDAVIVFISQFMTVRPIDDDDVEIAIKDFAAQDVRDVCEKILAILMKLKPAGRYSMFYGTKAQRRKLPIVFGKQALKVLDRPSLDIIRREDWHDRHAVSGVLKPISCWKVTARAFSAMQLSIKAKEKDWASFQANAERIA